jgi:hypothetical protein
VKLTIKDNVETTQEMFWNNSPSYVACLQVMATVANLAVAYSFSSNYEALYGWMIVGFMALPVTFQSIGDVFFPRDKEDGAAWLAAHMVMNITFTRILWECYKCTLAKSETLSFNISRTTNALLGSFPQAILQVFLFFETLQKFSAEKDGGVGGTATLDASEESRYRSTLMLLFLSVAFSMVQSNVMIFWLPFFLSPAFSPSPSFSLFLSFFLSLFFSLSLSLSLPPHFPKEESTSKYPAIFYDFTLEFKFLPTVTAPARHDKVSVGRAVANFEFAFNPNFSGRESDLVLIAGVNMYFLADSVRLYFRTSLHPPHFPTTHARAFSSSRIKHITALPVSNKLLFPAPFHTQTSPLLPPPNKKRLRGARLLVSCSRLWDDTAGSFSSFSTSAVLLCCFAFTSEGSTCLLLPMELPLTALHFVKRSCSVSSRRVCFSSSRTIPSMMMPPRKCQVSGNASA